MVLSQADAALEICLLILLESEARPDLPLYIFLQMPGNHIDLFAVSVLPWCVLLPAYWHFPGELVILWHIQYALVLDQRFSKHHANWQMDFLSEHKVEWSEFCSIMETCSICHQ